MTGTLRFYVEDDGSQGANAFDLYASAVASTNRLGIYALFTDRAASPVKYVVAVQGYRITNASIAVQGNNNDLLMDVEWSAQVDPSATNGPSATPTGNATSFNIFKLPVPV